MNAKNLNIFTLSNSSKLAKSRKGTSASQSVRGDGSKEEFQQTLRGFMSIPDQIREHNLEKRKFLAQVSETMRTESETRRQQLLALLKQSDAVEKPYDVKRKCLRIAMRIMRGDKVSMKDLQYLMENDPGLYLMAMLLRMPKEDPEEHECISDEENKSWDGSSSFRVFGGASMKASTAVSGVASAADAGDAD